MRVFGQVVAAEWGKLWSVRSTWWCLLSALALMVLSALTLGAGAATEALRRGTAAAIEGGEAAVSATVFAQFALVALAMLAVTAEYASGSIRATLQAVPARGVVLGAKAVVVAVVLAVAGVVSALVSAVVVHLVLSLEAFEHSGVLPPGETALDVLRVGAYFALTGVLTLGVGLALRSAAGTLTVVFMALLGLPLMVLMTGSQVAVEVSLRMPLFAGLAFMESTENLIGGPLPYSAGEGFGWLVLWTGLAVVAGFVVLRRRDA
ncbi:ABC transporter permease [Nonomuraea sp. NPDC050328]|uniref:ABC transporter permease n=1 Tax=Nonomuraea sp. NPDC050328 TaxID=3364361 RepID=UPI0037BDC2EC